MSRWIEAQKRKVNDSPPPTVVTGAGELEAGLQYMRSALKTAAHEARMACTKEESSRAPRKHHQDVGQLDKQEGETADRNHSTFTVAQKDEERTDS